MDVFENFTGDFKNFMDGSSSENYYFKQGVYSRLIIYTRQVSRAFKLPSYYEKHFKCTFTSSKYFLD